MKITLNYAHNNMGTLITDDHTYELQDQAQPTSRCLPSGWEEYTEWAALAKRGDGETVKVTWLFDYDDDVAPEDYDWSDVESITIV